MLWPLQKNNRLVFWNNPQWSPKSGWNPNSFKRFQKERIKKGELHGNLKSLTMWIILKNPLPCVGKIIYLMGTSDVTWLIAGSIRKMGNHRPIPWYFAKEKSSLKGFKEALFGSRTVAVYKPSSCWEAPNILKPWLQA